MNMTASSASNPSRVDLDAPAATSATAAPAPGPLQALSAADVEALQKSLGNGLSGFARKGDIVELHKRITEKFQNLPGELGALEAAHRDMLQTRIAALETSLSGLEAAVRIELPPLLGETVTAAVEARMPRPARKVRAVFMLLLVAGAGLAAGAVLHRPLLEYAALLGGF